MEIEKSCSVCEHFCQHYIKYKNRFIAASGHCMEKLKNGHSRKTDKVCECFLAKDFKAEKDKRLLSATEYLSEIANRLEELKEILK